jgi:hypothetical protein
MAMYSDLLFAVSGDPIDVRASIYKNIASNIFKVIQNFLVIDFFPKRKKNFLALLILDFF